MRLGIGAGFAGGRGVWRRGVEAGQATVFLSTFEKQLDAKRRIVVPQEFRSAAARSADGQFDGVYAFPSFDETHIELGGKALLDRYLALADEFEFGDEMREDVELVFSEGKQFAFDTAGRITLPEEFCQRFGLTDWVAVVGVGERFQIWDRDTFTARREQRRPAVRKNLVALRNEQRRARLGGAS